MKSEKFFLISAWLLIFYSLFSVFLFFEIALPPGTISSWAPEQWSLVRFFWEPTITNWIIFAFIIFLFFKKIYVAFFLLLLTMLFSVSGILFTLNKILNYGFIYPLYNISGLAALVIFIIAIVGSIFWVRNIIITRGKWWL